MSRMAVVRLEMVRSGRQPRTYWVRTGYVSLLATTIALGWLWQQSGGNDWTRQYAVGRAMFEIFSMAQLVLLTLAALLSLPGAIAEDRNRGTLEVLLSTSLSSRQIVVGKMLGGLIQVVQLFVAGLPVMFLLLVFGALSPKEVIAASVLILGASLLAGGIALGCSVLFGTGLRACAAAMLLCGAVWALPYQVVPLRFLSPYGALTLLFGIQEGGIVAMLAWSLIPWMLVVFAIVMVGAGLIRRLGLYRDRTSDRLHRHGGIRRLGRIALMLAGLILLIGTLAAAGFIPIKSAEGQADVIAILLGAFVLTLCTAALQGPIEERGSGALTILLSTVASPSMILGRYAQRAVAGTWLFWSLPCVAVLFGVVFGQIRAVSILYVPAMLAVYGTCLLPIMIAAGIRCRRVFHGILFGCLALCLAESLIALPVLLLTRSDTIAPAQSVYAIYWLWDGLADLITAETLDPTHAWMFGLHLLLHGVLGAAVYGVIRSRFDRLVARSS